MGECQLTHSGYNNYILTYTLLRDYDIGYTLYNVFSMCRNVISFLLMK